MTDIMKSLLLAVGTRESKLKRIRNHHENREDFHRFDDESCVHITRASDSNPNLLVTIKYVDVPP